MRIYLFVFIMIITFAPPLWADCKLSDISIKSMKVKFVDKCTVTPCIYMKGVAVLTNNCMESVGVQIKITGYDEEGVPLATRDLWPASTKNIAPGDYVFSLDQSLDYDPDLKKFSLTPVDIRRWRKK